MSDGRGLCGKCRFPLKRIFLKGYLPGTFFDGRWLSMRKLIACFLTLVILAADIPVMAQSGADDALGSIRPCAAYYNDDGVFRLIAFKIDELPNGMTFKIGSFLSDITANAENGIVYQGITDEGCVVSGGALAVEFAYNGVKNTVDMPAVKITEGSTADWTVSDDGHCITGYKGENGAVIIPNFINGKAITNIGPGQGSGNLTKASGSVISSAVISNGIIEINYGAFANMSSLTSVILPDTLEYIGMGAFYGTGINHDIEFPATLTQIDAMAFQGSGITGIVLNAGLEHIGQQAFYKCASLSGGLALPDTLKSVGVLGFAKCPGISGNLILPDSLEMLGAAAFRECTGITGDLTIPSGIKTVPEQAFLLCTGLNGRIVLSEGVEELEDLAFGGNGSGENAMNFEQIEFPSTLRHIGAYCFQFCSKIKHLELNEGLEFISDGAFDHVTGIDNETLVIPSTVKMIGGDYRVETNTGCGDHVFYDMGRDGTFKAFKVADGNAWFKDLDGVLYSADYTRMVAYPRGKTDEVFALPDTVTQLDLLSFSRPAYLKTLVLPDSYILSTDVAENSLNTDGSNLAVALYAYNKLEAVEVNDTNPNYTSKDGLLYSKDMKKLWYIPIGASGDIVIDDRCEEMELGCVYIGSKNYVKWTSLTIPGSVKSIDDNVLDFLNKNVKEKVNVDNSFYFVKADDGTVKKAEYERGDADLSGEINDADVKAVLRYISGVDMVGAINLDAADMDGSKTVDILDAVLIKAAVRDKAEEAS